ncbi:MAG: DMT family transporter, partial [Bacteroidetes bacterium]|nr:DMT family transporter [Bacteroidota bacterium]
LFFYLIHSYFIQEKVQKEDWPRLVLCALFGVALNMLLFFKGLAITTPINAALIMILAPIMVLLVSTILMKELIPFAKVIGVISGLIGASLIILSGSNIADLSISNGDLLVFLNATSYAFYLVLVKSLMKKYEAYTVVRWVFFFGLLMVFPFGIKEFMEVQWQTMPTKAWLSILYVLMGTTIFTYLLNAFALKITSATLVSTYIYLQPLLATLIAVLAGKDVLTWKKVLAAICIFLGVYLVSLKRKKPINLLNTNKLIPLLLFISPIFAT